MKARIIPIIFLMFLPVTNVQAQRKREVLDYNRVQDSIVAYNFQEAINLLEKDIARLTKKRKSTEEAERLLTIAHRGMGKLMATERIVLVDSIIVDKADALNHIHLSSESGSIQKMSQNVHTPDSSDCTLFRNQLENQTIFTQMDESGHLNLYQSVLVGNEWTKPVLVKGLKDPDTTVELNYPFMLTDGVTMYYAAKDDEGLGGYDIYMTRYDVDTQEFLAPENIGMPFNSPSNDYLFAIDEYHNLGWFVTDRRMPEGKVCVYTFIPNETRKIYNESEVGLEHLRRLASIHSIQDTWIDKKNVSEAHQRLQELLADKKLNGNNRQFTFVVNDHLTYHNINEFRSNESIELIKEWISKTEIQKSTRTHLNKLRDKYAMLDEAQQKQMAPQIRMMEDELESILSEIDKLEKLVRLKELNK